jgi:predicted membrane-bound mannosyltransferase
VLGLATLLRLHGLATWPLEQDELYTIRDAVAFGQQINWLRPFYFFLQQLLLQLLPPTPLFLRMPPFLFGVLGVWLTWVLGRKVFGTTAGLVAAFMVAISPWHLYASQFARYWTLVYARPPCSTSSCPALWIRIGRRSISCPS